MSTHTTSHDHLTPQRQARYTSFGARGVQIISAGWSRLPAWATRPEFLVILGIGALLRLILPGQSSFLSDQAELLALARSALHTHALPVTGIRSSIGTLNPPASIYLLLPFALSSNPLWAVLATALANVVALVGLYALTNRYAGRRAAFLVGLLYATASWPIYFSRFIWQQNLLAPVVVFFMWTLLRGVIDQRRGWLTWNIALWAIAVQLHPTAAPLLALTALGVLLRWRALRWRDSVLAALVLLLLFLPSVAWELVSQGSDVALFKSYIAQPSVLNTDAISQLLTALSPLAANTYGLQTFYATTFPIFGWLAVLVTLLYGASCLWLIAILLRVGHQYWLRSRGNLTRAEWTPPWDWRFLLMLGLWQLLPLLSMLKHSAIIQEHYMLALLPAPFLQMGLFLDWLAERLAPTSLVVARRLADRLGPSHRQLVATYARRVATAQVTHLRRWARIAVLALVVIIATAQTYGVAAQFVTIQSGDFDGVNNYSYSHYGIPLNVQEGALDTTVAAARAHHATAYVASDTLQQEAFGYLATAGNDQASVYDATQCVIVPSAGASSAVELAAPDNTVTPLFSQMTGVSLLRRVPVLGSSSMPLYLVSPGARLPNEVAMPTQPTSTNASGVRLVGYQFSIGQDGTARLILHWTGAPHTTKQAPAYWYGNKPNANAPQMASYMFYTQQVNSAHAPSGPAYASACPALAWGAKDDVYAVIPIPLPLTAQAARWSAANWHVWIEQQAITVSQPALGSLHMATGATSLGPAVLLPERMALPFNG